MSTFSIFRGIVTINIQTVIVRRAVGGGNQPLPEDSAAGQAKSAGGVIVLVGETAEGVVVLVVVLDLIPRCMHNQQKFLHSLRFLLAMGKNFYTQQHPTCPISPAVPQVYYCCVYVSTSPRSCSHVLSTKILHLLLHPHQNECLLPKHTPRFGEDASRKRKQ